MANNVQVRTGPSSFLNFNEADAKEWRKTHKEYTDADAAADEPGPASTTEAREEAEAEAPAKKSKS